MAIQPGTTRNDFSLKAGRGNARITDRPTAIALTAITGELSVALTDVAVAIVTTTDIAAKVGDVLCFPRTREKVFVISATSATPFTTGVQRAVDGTTAQALPIGATVVKKNIGVRINDAAGYGIDAVTLTVDDGSANADLIDASYQVFRRGKDTGSAERLFIISHNATTLETKRNINLDKDALVSLSGGIADIVDDEILFGAFEGYKAPESDTLRKLWYEAEVTNDISLMEGFDSINTESNLRTGTNFAGQSRFSVQLTLSITDPEFLAKLRPNRPLQINNASGTMQKDQGYSMRSYVGEEIEGIMVYITGREAITKNQLQILAYDAQLTEMGDISISDDQRTCQVTLMCSHWELADAPGYVRNPLQC